MTSNGLYFEGRYGIQQLMPHSQKWTTCTIWCGYDWEDAVAAAQHANSSIVTTPTAFRVIDRHTGETFDVAEVTS